MIFHEVNHPDWTIFVAVVVANLSAYLKSIFPYFGILILFYFDAIKVLII